MSEGTEFTVVIPGEPIVQLTENGVQGFEILCRICANSSDHLIAIYSEEGVSNGLADKMNRYLPAKVHKTDLLPLQCCYQCASTVLTWHELVVASVEADRRLRNIQDEIEKQLAEQQAAEASEDEECPNVPVYLFADRASKEFVTKINRGVPGRPDQRTPQEPEVCKKKPTRADGGNQVTREQARKQRATNRTVAQRKLADQMALKDPELRSAGRESMASRRLPEPDALDAQPGGSAETTPAKATFQCTVCGKYFAKKVSLTYHMCIHRDERPYSCTECAKSFRSKSTLKRHVDHVHLHIKNFACDLCGRWFASAPTRDDHRRTHTRERPLICEACGKSFGSKSALRTHALFHTETRDFACAVCQRQFRRKQELVYHSYTHTGAWPYVCKTCGQRYPRKSQLTVHQFRHSDRRPLAARPRYSDRPDRSNGP